MIQNLSLPDDYLLGFSLKPPAWARKAAAETKKAVTVNLAVAKKELTPGRDLRRVAAGAAMVVTGPIAGAVLASKILTKSDVAAVKKAVTVNTANIVKAAKKVSMNKIVDAFTPDVVLPPEEEGGIKKLLPLLAAGGAGLLFLL